MKLNSRTREEDMTNWFFMKTGPRTLNSQRFFCGEPFISPYFCLFAFIYPPPVAHSFPRASAFKKAVCFTEQILTANVFSEPNSALSGTHSGSEFSKMGYFFNQYFVLD